MGNIASCFVRYAGPRGWLAALLAWIPVTAGTARAQAIVRPDHVVLVIEENRSFSQIIGSASAPYINSLAAQGALFTQSYGLGHPSQPNYISLFSGSNQGVGDNTIPSQLFTTPNLGAALLAAGLTFGGYSEGLPAVGATDTQVGNYVRKHNPWVNWQNSPTNGLPASVNMPFTSFPTPANLGQLPTVSFVVPDLSNDMHDGSIARGDAWLQTHLDPYIQWAKTNNSLFILTFDEDDNSENNRIATLFVGPMIQPGLYNQPIDHYNVLRTIEDMYGLSHSGQAAAATPITGVWVASVPEPPPTLLMLAAAAALGLRAARARRGRDTAPPASHSRNETHSP